MNAIIFSRYQLPSLKLLISQICWWLLQKFFCIYFHKTKQFYYTKNKIINIKVNQCTSFYLMLCHSFICLSSFHISFLLSHTCHSKGFLLEKQYWWSTTIKEQYSICGALHNRRLVNAMGSTFCLDLNSLLLMSLGCCRNFFNRFEISWI